MGDTLGKTRKQLQRVILRVPLLLVSLDRVQTRYQSVPIIISLIIVTRRTVEKRVTNLLT
jgi:hypothetical protein